jgi:carbon storage regulator CsrA
VEVDRRINHEKEDRTMLVLTRKCQEAVVVGGTNGFELVLKVTVLEIKGASVRLGFEADAGVPVHRLEVWERIHSYLQPANPSAGSAVQVE